MLQVILSEKGAEIAGQADIRKFEILPSSENNSELWRANFVLNLKNRF